MKTYTGYRMGNNAEGAVTVHFQDGHSEPLSLRHDLRIHSEQFNWGYAGSGPAQLALALACDALGDDDRAQVCYQRLKRSLIEQLARDGWTLTEAEVLRHIERTEIE